MVPCSEVQSYRIRYGALLAPVVASLQELAEENSTLQMKVDLLDQENLALKNEIQEIKRVLNQVLKK